MDEAANRGDCRRQRPRNAPANHPVERVIVLDHVTIDAGEELPRSLRWPGIGLEQYRVQLVEARADREPSGLIDQDRVLLIAPQLAERRAIAGAARGSDRMCTRHRRRRPAGRSISGGRERATPRHRDIPRTP